MKVDFGYEFKDFNGKTIPKDRGQEGSQTLGSVCVDSLSGVIPPTKQEPSVSGTEAMKRFHLAEDIHRAEGPLDVSVDNIKLLKDLVAVRYIPLVVAQAWKVLDPPPVVENVPPKATEPGVPGKGK